MAGHTTGGRREVSEEVTAIPLEERNVSHRKGRTRGGGWFTDRPHGRQRQPSNRSGQSVDLILRSRRKWSGGDWSRWRARPHAARWRCAVFIVASRAAAAFGDTPARDGNGRRA